MAFTSSAHSTQAESLVSRWRFGLVVTVGLNQRNYSRSSQVGTGMSDIRLRTC